MPRQFHILFLYEEIEGQKLKRAAIDVSLQLLLEKIEQNEKLICASFELLKQAYERRIVTVFQSQMKSLASLFEQVGAIRCTCLCMCAVEQAAEIGDQLELKMLFDNYQCLIEFFAEFVLYVDYLIQINLDYQQGKIKFEKIFSKLSVSNQVMLVRDNHRLNCVRIDQPYQKPFAHHKCVMIPKSYLLDSSVSFNFKLHPYDFDQMSIQSMLQGELAWNPGLTQYHETILTYFHVRIDGIIQ